MRVIAIDGPAGSGKSTVARKVADRLGWGHLDTGAMYRSVTLAALRRDADLHDAVALGALAKSVVIVVDGSAVSLDGEDVSAAIRGADVSGAVSLVAAHPPVRAELVRRQREWVRERDGAVVEGRDIGTVVFPDAELKVFLTASEEERVRRRTAEHGDEVAAEVLRRDRIDGSRAVSPTMPAADALIVDTTGRTVDEVVEEVLSKL